MVDWMRLVLIALAVYRLAQLVTIDKGPFAVFLRARAYAKTLAAYWTAKYNTAMPATWERSGAALVAPIWRGIAELLDCPYCAGVWFAALGAAAFYVPSAPVDAIIVWLGLAGAQALAQEVGNR